MNGQRYLCNYYKRYNRKLYYKILVERFNINNDNDKDRCYKLIVLATEYATKERLATNDQDRNTCLHRISHIDNLLREHIRNANNVRIVEVRG